MNSIDASPELVLRGLDGGNPLAFLAAVGTTVTATNIWPKLRIHWQLQMGGWRPVLTGCVDDEEVFLSHLHTALRSASMKVFDINDKLPFAAKDFVKASKAAVEESSPAQRRDCDLLTGLGTDMYPEQDSTKTEIFRDTSLRMVRSGDSNGQGLPFYAKAIRQATEINHLRSALFQQWDYRDTGFSLRWDPIEDQRYALRWRDPSKSDKSIMLGANSLAIEALQFLPTVTVGSRSETTGFYRQTGQGTFFIWPIWTVKIGLDTLRSLLALPDLRSDEARAELQPRGVAEVYKSQRIHPNQYYSNFAPAHPA